MEDLLRSQCVSKENYLEKIDKKGANDWQLLAVVVSLDLKTDNQNTAVQYNVKYFTVVHMTQIYQAGFVSRQWIQLGVIFNFTWFWRISKSFIVFTVIISAAKIHTDLEDLTREKYAFQKPDQLGGDLTMLSYVSADLIRLSLDVHSRSRFSLAAAPVLRQFKMFSFNVYFQKHVIT